MSFTASDAQKLFAAADARDKVKRPFQQWTLAQLNAIDLWDSRDSQKLLIYYPTGKGKTKLSLTMMKMREHNKVIVLAPPKTFPGWKRDAETLGLELLIMSHQKFRDKATKLPRNVPIIIDEFHMMGKHAAVGFSKLRRMAQAFPGIILGSATPNYNDADRCYNVEYILSDSPTGDYLNWVVENCTTIPNPFARTPDVTGLKHYDGAPDFLAKQPYTAYIVDDAEWTTIDLPINIPVDLTEFELYGFNRREHRMMASDMEAFHRRKALRFIDESGKRLRTEIALALVDYMLKRPEDKFLVYSTDKDIANAAHEAFLLSPFQSNLITGDMSEKQVERAKQIFVNIAIPAILTGTAALATGVDEIDGACNHLIVLDPTPDDSLFRQLIGRVLPRGDYKRDTIVTNVVAI